MEKQKLNVVSSVKKIKICLL